MDRLLLISTVFLISITSWASTKGQIQFELKHAEETEAQLYQKLRASMGAQVALKRPKLRLQASPAPTEYKIKLIKQKARVAKYQKR